HLSGSSKAGQCGRSIGRDGYSVSEAERVRSSTAATGSAGWGAGGYYRPAGRNHGLEGRLRGLPRRPQGTEESSTGHEGVRFRMAQTALRHGQRDEGSSMAPTGCTRLRTTKRSARIWWVTTKTLRRSSLAMSTWATARSF